MTEAEWLSCDVALAMIRFISDEKAGRKARIPTRQFSRKRLNRKLRLFFCARCREMWAAMLDPRSRTAVEVAERFADGLLGRSALRQARLAAYDLAARPGVSSAEHHAYWATWLDVMMLTLHEHSSWDEYLETLTHEARRNPDTNEAAAQVAQFRDSLRRERATQAALLHDLLGNPFRPVRIDRRSLTEEVLALAGTIYEERAFNRLPDLANALSTAGCANQDLLSHLRGSGPHVRGCWVVDLLLGKE